MSYYPSIEEDLQRAKDILKKGKLRRDEVPDSVPDWMKDRFIAESGTIFAGDVYAAYKLLESFVEEITQLRAARAVDQQYIFHLETKLKDLQT